MSTVRQLEDVIEDYEQCQRNQGWVPGSGRPEALSSVEANGLDARSVWHVLRVLRDVRDGLIVIPEGDDDGN